MDVVLRRPRRYPHADVDPLSVEKPVESRPCSPTSVKEVEQPCLVAPKMAEDSDTSKVDAAPNRKVAATSNKSSTDRFEFVPTGKMKALEASKLNKEGPKRPIRGSNKSLPVASDNAPKRRRFSSSSSLTETARNIISRISHPPLHLETPKPKLENKKLPVAGSKKNTENRPGSAETIKKQSILPPPGEITKKGPNSSSTKQMEGTPLPAKEAPKEKSKGYINRSDPKPNQKAEDAKNSPNQAVVKGKNTRLTPSQKNEEASKKGSSSAPPDEDEVLESSSMDMFTDNYFIEQHHNFYKHWKDYNMEIGKRLLSLDVNNTQHCCENVTLKNRLEIKDGQIQYLKERLSHQSQLNKSLREKYIETWVSLSTAQKHYDSQQEIGKSVIGKQKAEMDSQKSEIVSLKLQLSNMEKNNRDMTSALNRLKTELKQIQDSNTELLNQKLNLMAALEEPKLNKGDMVDGKGLETEISPLDPELKDCSALNQGMAKIQEQQCLPNETAMQLVFIQNEGNSMTFVLDENENEYERMRTSLSDRIKGLEAAKNTLIEINEDFAKELEEEKAKASVERKVLKDAYKVVISSLTSTSCQSLLELKELSKSYEDLKAENLFQRSLHEERFNQCELQRLEQEEANNRLQNEIQIQTQIFQAELSEKEKQKQMETNKIQALTLNFEGEKERYENKISALEAAVEQSDRELKDEQEKVLSLVARNYELERSFSNLQDEKEKIAYEFSVAKKMFIEELKNQADTYKNKLFGLPAAPEEEENEPEENNLIIDEPSNVA